MTQLYKWMLPYRRTSYQNVKWPVEVDEWTHAEAPVLCRSGWHGVEERHVLNHLPSLVGATLWVVETRGVIVHGDDKFAAAQMKLVRPIGTTTERNLRLFAADCAQDVLPLFEAKYPHDMRPRDAIAVARRYAVGSATKAELAAARAAWYAAWYAAGDAAWAKYSNWLVVRLESGY